MICVIYFLLTNAMKSAQFASSAPSWMLMSRGGVKLQLLQLQLCFAVKLQKCFVHMSDKKSPTEVSRSLFLLLLDDNSNQSSIADSSPVKQENSCSTSPTPEPASASHRENSEAKTDQSPDSKRGQTHTHTHTHTHTPVNKSLTDV